MRPDWQHDWQELDTVAGEPLVIEHNLGRPVSGWSVIWSTAPIALTIADPSDNGKNALTLQCSASATVRLVLI